MKAGAVQLAHQQRGDGLVVIAGRIDRRNSDKPLEQDDKIPGMAVDVLERRHETE
jgi:hypothetical protein